MNLFKLNQGKTILAMAISAALSAAPAIADNDYAGFERIATFPVYLNTSIDKETVAEIVAASADGNTLIYTDGKTQNLGFVDITDPANPLPAGVVGLGGEPTSVAVKGAYALAAVNTSSSFTEPSGNLQVIDIESGERKATIDLGGQPDSIAVSPDGRYAAIAIENERDEDLSDGAPPQAPAGFFVIVDMLGEPTDWTTRNVNLISLDGMLFADDPEPEYVDINRDNIAVVTLQENNHIVLIDLASGAIVNHFSAGTVNLEQVDTKKDGIISLDNDLLGVPREPDGVSWISNTQFVTADEGDLDGGSRGFTVFNIDGSVAYAAGNTVEHAVVRHGHFPDKRAGKKGNETEGAEFGQYGDDKLLFVGSERASVVLVYKVKNAGKAGKHKGHELVQLKQVLATATKPEGLLAIPQRNLFVAAGEEDARGDNIRSGISIYQLSDEPNYPTVVSKDRSDGTPIPWGALSGLAMDLEEAETAYTVQDSFYKQSRVFILDIEETPAKITKEIILNDAMGKLAAIAPSLVNDDDTVNLDPEGIATRTEGGFWLASEGKDGVLNLLLRLNKAGLIEEVVTLPALVNARQLKFGFEGVVAVDNVDTGESLYVAFQREWTGDPTGHVRIARYNTASAEWAFYYYPLDTVESANGGWVGLSDITYLGNDEFAVIERDNQGGLDAAIKRLYTFSINGLMPMADKGGVPSFPLLSKTLLHNLMDDLSATGGLTLEKIEGLAVTKEGTVLVVNDNDGVDDTNGETQLLKIEGLFE